MLNRYYEQELGNLRKLGAEFARSNPALAPLLGSDRASDPDVERLLEGVAFMTGLIRHRLEDDFPEFIQNLAQLLFPNFLRPLPCMTIMPYERSEEHTSELQSLMRISYAVFCLKKKNTK